MALQNFVDYVSTVSASWLNKVDVLLDTVFQNATTAAQARTALGVTATGADTAYCLKSNNLSDVTAATARTNLGAAASGAVTSSGLTQSTGKLLGRTTASTGAIEEIGAGSALALSGTNLAVDLTGLTEDTSPDRSADYVITYDASAAANKKVKLSNVGPFGFVATDSDRTITSAGTFTFNHGLGSIPKYIQCNLVCQTGEFNYSAGDVILVDTQVDPTNAVGRGISIKMDSTSIVVRYGSTANVFVGINATTGAVGALTNANWKLRLRAFT